MKVVTSPTYNDTLYVGPKTPNGDIEIEAVLLIDGVEHIYQPPLSSEWVVYCDPAKRDEVVKAIRKISKEQMFLA